MIKRLKKGFTLVEIVIVIAVIAILAGVLLPTFLGILNNAKKTSDSQIAKNMTTELYPFIYSGVKYFTASDIRFLVNVEELEPINNDNANFWLNKKTLEVIVSKGKDLPANNTVSAEGEKTTLILEEFIPGYLLLDTKGSELANAINEIKKIEEREDYVSIVNNLKNEDVKRNLNLSEDQYNMLLEHIENFDPSRTLYVNDFGYYTEAVSEEFDVERVVDGEVLDLTIAKVLIENIVFSNGILTLPAVDTSGVKETNIFANEYLEISFVNDVILPSSLKTIDQDNVLFYVDNTIPSRDIDTDIYNINKDIKTQGLADNIDNRLFSVYLLNRVLGLRDLNVNARPKAIAECTFNIATDKAKLITEDTQEKDQYSELSITVNIPRYGKYELLEGGVDEFGKPLTEDLPVDSPEASGRTPVLIYNDEVITQRYRYVRLANGKIRVEAKVFDEFGVVYSGSAVYTPNIKIENFTFNKGTLSFSTPLDVPISQDEELFYKLYYSTDNGATYNEIAVLRGNDYISENALADYVLNEYGNTENNLKNYMLYLIQNEGYNAVDSNGNYYGYNEFLGRYCWHNPNGTENTQINVIPSLTNMSNYYILKTNNDELLDGNKITKIHEESRIEIIEHDDPSTTNVVEKILKELYYMSTTEITQVDEIIDNNKCISVSVKEDHNTTERYIQPYTIPHDYLVQKTDSASGQTYNTIFAKIELLVRKNGQDKILSSNTEEFGGTNNSIKQSYFEETIFNQDMASYGYDYKFRDPLYYTTDNTTNYTELFSFTDKKILSYEKDSNNQNAYYIVVEGIGNSEGQGVNTYIYDKSGNPLDTQSYNATYYVSYDIIANRINNITITGQDNYYTLSGNRDKYNSFIYKQRTSYVYSPTQQQIPSYTTTLTKFNGKQVSLIEGQTNSYEVTIYNGEVFNPLTTLFTVIDSNGKENLCNASIFAGREETIGENEKLYTFYTQSGEIKVYCKIQDIKVTIKFVNQDIESQITMSPSKGGSIIAYNYETKVITCGYNDTITLIAPEFEEDSEYAFVSWFEEQNGLNKIRLSGKTTYTYNVPDNDVTLYCEIATSYLFDDTFVFSYTDSTKTCRLTLCNNKEIKNIYIPSYCGEYKVVEISNNAFTGCTQINKIIIPNTVEVIGTNSFAGSNIEINEESKYFGPYLYKYNDSTGLVKNYKVLEGTKIIGNNAFKNNSNLEMIYLPDSVNQINDYAFERVTNLEYIFVSPNSNLAKIGQYAFNNCLKLKGIFVVNNIDEIFENKQNIPSQKTFTKTLTTLGNYAFQMCLDLEEFDFENVETIGQGTFNNCVKLDNVDLENSKVTKLQNNTFSNCASLMTVRLGNNINNLGTSVFAACNSLEEFVLPSSIETYGTNIFDSCLSLKKVTIPQNLTVLPIAIFKNCSALVEIVNLDFTKITKIQKEVFLGCKIYPFNDLVIGKEGVDFEIGISAFQGCEQLNSVVFKGKWTTTDLGAITNVFYGCLNLKSVDMNGVTNIGTSFFYDCILLETVSNLTLSEIKNQIFYNCSNLTTKVVSSFANYTSIGQNAFTNCYNIPFGNIVIGNSNTQQITLGASAFYTCDKLTGITINAKSVIINSSILNCKTLSSIIINCDNLTLNSTSAITGNPILEIVKFNAKNLVGGQLKNNTLYNNPMLREVVIPYNTTSIGSNVISSAYLENLTKYYDEEYFLEEEKGNYNVTIVTASFNGSSFASSKMIDGFLVKQTTTSGVTTTTLLAYLGTQENITIPYSENDTLTIQNKAFANSTLIKNLTMENNVKVIGDFAFQNATIESLTFNQNEMPEISANALDGINPDLTVVVPTSLVNQYKLNPIFQDFTVNNSMLYTLTIRNNIVTGYTGSPIKVELEDNIIGIANDVFKDCLTLEYIDLNNVTSIGNNAFSGCSNLKTIIIDNVTQIGDYAFNGCQKLVLDVLPSNLASVGSNAFNGVTSLTEIILPETLQTIGANAFTSALTIHCKATPATIGTNPFPVATKIYVPNTLETIYKTQWSSYKDIILPNTAVIITSITVENGVLKKFVGTDAALDLSTRTDITSIGADAFKGITTLKDLVLPNTITSIGNNAFNGCTSLKNITGMDFTKVTSIGQNAFTNCKALTYNSLTIKANTIGNNAFQNCSSLTSVVLDNTMTTLPNYLFSGCSKITSITLPTSITSIGTYAFSGCSKLKTIQNLDFSKLTTIGAYAFNNCQVCEFGEITLTDKLVANIGKYAFQNCKKLTKVIINHDDTQTTSFTLVEGIFSGATGLTQVNLSQTINKLGTKVFNGCITLNSVYTDNKLDNTLNLESYIIDIGANAFTNCDAITTINTYGLNLNVNANAFENMDNLVNVNFNASVSKLGNNALKQNMKLTKLNIENIIAFGTTVFNGCSNLKEFDLGTATELKVNCFGGATYVETVIGANLTQIGNQAFQNCRNLKNLIIDWTKITSIGNNAFENCINLEFKVYQNNNGTMEVVDTNEFVLGNSETTLTLGTNVFRNAFQPNENQTTKIDTIRFASSLANGKISDYTFYMARSIKTIIFDKPLTQIGNYAFNTCVDLEEIKGAGFVTENITAIGNNAFENCRKLVINNNQFVVGNSSSALTVGVSAFKNMLKLEKVEFNQELTTIGSALFQGCVNLKEVIFKAGEDGLSLITEVGANAFNGCIVLKSINYRKADNSLIDFDLENATIKNYAFANCKNLEWTETLRIGTLNETYTFQNNYKLKNVIVNAGTTVANYVFDGCLNLKTVALPSTIVTFGTQAFNNCINLTNLLSSEDTTKGFNLENVTALNTRAFYNCVNLSLGIENNGNVVLNNLTTFGTYVFGNNYNLKNITFKNNLPSTTIPEATFQNCINLNSITMTNNVTVIGKYAFDNCYVLETIKDEQNIKLDFSSVTTINDYAFNNCQSLVLDLKLSALKTLGANYVFQNAKSLNSVDFDTATITSLGQYLFYGCEKLQTVKFSSKIASIGNYTFANCYSLKLNGEDFKQITTMGTGCFANCQSITKVILGKDLTTIGANAFENCVSLKTLTYEENPKLTTIGNYAFNGCVSLINVKLPSTLKTINQYAFQSCTLLTLIELDRDDKNTSLTISSNVFNGQTKTFFVFENDTYLNTYKTKVKTFASYMLSKERFNSEAMEKGIWLLESTLGEEKVYSLMRYTDLYTSVVIDITSKTFVVKNGEEVVLSIIDKPVTLIYYYAFSDCENLQTLTINGNINTIVLYRNYNFKSNFEVINTNN